MVFYVIDRSMNIVATMTNDVPNALMIDDSSGGQNIILTNGVATGSYSFKTDPYHRDSVYIKAGNYIAFKDKYSKYRLYTIITVSGDTELTVTCEDIGLDLINEMSGAWDFGNVDLTLDFFLNRVFGGTGWKIVYETAGIKDTTRNLSYTTVTDTRLKRLESVMSAFGYEGDFEIKMSGAHVTEQIFHVYQKILNANSSSPVQRFMNDMNLISLNREESIADLYTAVLPTGGTVDGKTVDISQIVYDDGRFFTTDNDNVLYDRVSAEKWSRFSGTVNEKSTDDHYIMGHYTSSTTSASALFEEAKAQLIANCDAKISVEAKLLELDADLGDYIEIVDHSKTTDILLKARVQSVTNYYTQVGEDTGTLANYQLIEDTSQEFRDMLERIKTQIKSVTGSTVEYTVSDQGSIPPTDGWSADNIPTVGDGQFLWTRTTTTFSDSTSTVAYSISKNGVNGRSLISTKTHYAIGSDTTTIPSKWQEEWPKELTSGDYLWTRNTFYYSSGDPTVSYTITYYPKDGNNYTSITNYFLASSLSSGVTAEEIIKNGSKNPADQKVTAASQYLWTVEELSFENYDGTVELQKTTPHIISVYSSDGVGIIDNGIIEWYQVTNSMTEAPTSWSKTPQLMTPDKKYLWNYEETIYSNGKHVRSDPVVIGVYGDKGEKGESSYTHIRYCDEYPDDFDDTYTGTTGKNPMFIGVYTGPLATAPTTIMAYQWSQIRGNQGPTGNGILSTTYFYAVTTDNVKPTANKVTSVDMPPLDSVNKYLWRKTITDYSDPSVEDKVVVELQAVYGDTGLKGDTGKPGEQGIPGTPGKDGVNGTDGKTSYFHIKYSPVLNPTSAQMSETPDIYIGTYVDYEPNDSTDSSKYTWSRFQGVQGDKGENGIPGVNGADGKTSYLHIAYANSSDGKTDFDVSDSINKLYIGQYTDFNPTDSTDYTRYSWTKIKGEQGLNGADGETYYTWIKYADSPTSGMSDNPSGKKYLGVAYNKSTATESSTYSDYAWSLIKGDKGDTGTKGDTGATGNGIKSIVYTYARTTSQTAPSADSITATTMPALDATNKYLWQKEVITYTNGQSQTTVLLLAVYGNTGAKGDRGDPGSPGKDGTSVTITSQAITYQASSSGTAVPSGSWVANPPSVAKGQYLWTRTVVNYSDGKKTTAYSVGYQGTNGQNGSPGKDGATGPAGRGIKSTSITYQAWANGTSTPSGTWVTDPPKTGKDKPYLWTRTVITYTDNSTSTSYSVGSTIEGVQEDINSAKDAASVAQDTANKAMNNAIQAQGTSADAFNKANQAQSSANAASDKAETAITSSKEAQSLATQAQSLANKANSDAYNAMEAIKAQNQVFYADSTGAHIRKAGTNNETRVVADGVEIIADNTKVAEFTKTQGRVSNLVADKFLYVGAHRLEKFTQDGEVGTGFFWTGGAL